MNRALVLCVVLLVSAVNALHMGHIRKPSEPTGVANSVPSYVVNLDLPPSERWNDIAPNYKDQFGPIIAYVKSRIPAKVYPLVDELMAKLDPLLGAPFADEIRGLAQATGIDLGFLVTMNLFYDITAACTSIVASNSNGTIYHGRNLDYDIPNLQNITVQVDFQSGGKTVYQGTTYVGYAGLLTGLRPGAFSISLDERNTNGSVWDNLFEALFAHGKPIGFFIRDTLANVTTYDDALQQLRTQHLIAVAYLIIGGSSYGQGAVVTRERQSAIDVWEIDMPSRWYLVQTNYDHWLPDPPNDQRRIPAEQRMNATDADHIDAGYLLNNVLSLYPNLNGMTTYTSIMSGTQDLYYTVTQNNPPPPTVDTA